MNWYNQLKTASYEVRDVGYQDGWTDIFGDMQRYALDAYRCQVFITKTSQKITVSVSVAHDQFGTIVYQEFWKYGLNELTKAKSTFSAVKTVVAKIFDEFESSEIPNNMLHTSVREAVRYIDIDNKPSTRILSIDAARTEKGVVDWRSSLYGNRYPEVTGF